MEKILVFVSTQCAPVLGVPEIVQCRMVLALCEKMRRDMRQESTGVFLDKMFLFCLAWGLGGLLEQVTACLLSKGTSIVLVCYTL
jgi:hypothetical protein